MAADPSASSAPETPHGLVIGAMKAGTTTLFHDLRRMPEIALADKELSFFQTVDTDGAGSAAAAVAYWSQFDHTGTTKCSVDVSTTYTMAPDVAHVPERAAEVLDEAPRLVYLVRDPIERAVSHHHHMVARGATTQGFDAYVDADPGVIAYGRYDMQAQRWTDVFGTESLLVVRLEDYADRWHHVMPRILDHLGVPGASMPADAPDRMNTTADARVFTGASRTLMESGPIASIYNRGVRRLVPDTLRTRIRNLVLPAPPERPDAPSQPVLDRLVDEFSDTAAWVAEQTETAAWDLRNTAEGVGR